MSNIYALINSQGSVVDLCLWDGTSAWAPPEGLTTQLSDGTASIGGTFSNGIFSPPLPPPPLTGNLLILSQIDALEASQTDRMVREAFNSSANIFPTGHAYAGLTSAQAFAQIETQIAVLRAQLT
jgi:hypothetical protein